ncbi:hypothetical protein PUMCH_003087 [Australozyma saopauloensis]|uniref:DUF155 domain-containing protein n=1 Tax=Australozyma saopauloensis TaxID=291208 RepID=A0AAX4HBE6_9ASCO|nr:hypothetical protein PUMCH_003087 [[Candida] saopauloensis]
MRKLPYTLTNLTRTFTRAYTALPNIPIPKKKPTKPALKALRRTNQRDSRSTESVLSSLLSKQQNKEVGPAELQHYLKPVTAITIGDGIDLKHVLQELIRYGVNYEVLLEDEVIAFTTGKSTHAVNGQVMILANGTVVGWGLTESKMLKKLVPPLIPATLEPCNCESEEMDYVEVGSDEAIDSSPQSFMQGDVLVIPEKNPRERQLDMAAFAIGFSRSTRLSILEESLEKIIQHTRENSEILNEGFRITLNELDILRVTGRLFKLRAKLNLYSELIETPDLYWSEPTLEKIYEAISHRLDIPLRISIMNRKLDYVTEEQRALLSFLNEKKSTRLEWIIILLIMVEVLFEIVPFVGKYLQSPKQVDDGKKAQ